MKPWKAAGQPKKSCSILKLHVRNLEIAVESLVEKEGLPVTSSPVSCSPPMLQSSS